MHIIKKEAYINQKEKIYVSKSTYHHGFGEHSHDFLEIVYIHGGSAVHCINETQYKVKRGDLFLLDYTDTHTFSETSDDFMIITCSFLPEIIDDSLVGVCNTTDILQLLFFKPLIDDNNDFRFSINLVNKQNEFDGLLEDMCNEFQNKNRGYQLVLKCYLILILARIFRLANVKNTQKQNAGTIEMIEKAMAYLRDNFSNRIRIEDIAKTVFLSPGYFATVFKNQTGCNPTEYIRKIRISQACDMLAGSDKSVSEIIYDVGYRDAKFFYQIFRRYTGMTPGEYRKRV